MAALVFPAYVFELKQVVTPPGKAHQVRLIVLIP